jgi:hypothetical protein
MANVPLAVHVPRPAPWKTRAFIDRLRREGNAASTPICEDCGKRRLTYQASHCWGMDSTACVCSECFYSRAVAHDAACINCKKPIAEHFLGAC